MKSIELITFACVLVKKGIKHVALGARHTAKHDVGRLFCEDMVDDDIFVLGLPPNLTIDLPFVLRGPCLVLSKCI